MTTKVGIVAQDHNGKFGVNTDYLNFIEIAGGLPIMIPPMSIDDFDILDLDALLLPGGADILSVNYGEIPAYVVGSANPYLEYFDKAILPSWISRELPVFGICRGLQTLNVYFGGTLYQNVVHPYSSHEKDLVHKVSTTNKTFKVNSFHHQAINQLGGNLKVEATSEDGLIEAVSYKKHIFAVQWHPERILDRYSIDNFINILQ